MGRHFGEMRGVGSNQEASDKESRAACLARSSAVAGFGLIRRLLLQQRVCKEDAGNTWSR